MVTPLDSPFLRLFLSFYWTVSRLSEFLLQDPDGWAEQILKEKIPWEGEFRPKKRSVSWVNSVLRQFWSHGLETAGLIP